jgi:hypothetical protein
MHICLYIVGDYLFFLQDYALFLQFTVVLCFWVINSTCFSLNLNVAWLKNSWKNDLGVLEKFLNFEDRVGTLQEINAFAKSRFRV